MASSASPANTLFVTRRPSVDGNLHQCRLRSGGEGAAQRSAGYAPTNQNIFFLGARMPEKVPDSAIKFYEDRFVNLWRFADEQLAKTQYLAGDEITAADLAEQVDGSERGAGAWLAGGRSSRPWGRVRT